MPNQAKAARQPKKKISLRSLNTALLLALGDRSRHFRARPPLPARIADAEVIGAQKQIGQTIPVVFVNGIDGRAKSAAACPEIPHRCE